MLWGSSFAGSPDAEGRDDEELELRGDQTSATAASVATPMMNVTIHLRMGMTP
jgi:hypothetical protein